MKVIEFEIDGKVLTAYSENESADIALDEYNEWLSDEHLNYVNDGVEYGEHMQQSGSMTIAEYWSNTSHHQKLSDLEQYLQEHLITL